MVVVSAALFIFPAMGSGISEKSINDEIIVMPSVDKYITNFSEIKYQHQISQGEMVYHTRYVSPFTSKIDVTLTWDENYGDLELYVYTPDNSFVGHYTDLYDSPERDGMIDIDVQSSSGFLPMGDWKLNVYGGQVSGSSLSYSLL
ncbi:hypothetical protein J2128_001613 [Methanomicrobium sp. W14]|uniref:hypothetical protein n=1 Tax=Methanomicrobium sp. W14 TaxID=2817839 RepID=UPI001FDA2853|nr:hypothetical protein [Methanomicrobium sp. W14]MBP2133659.1 hypothetical protein [Methanomicrobium sp. W14]